MVDYFVDSDELLGSGYYVTSLECNNYNPSIDGSVTLTVSLNDVYGDAVVGEVVTVTASQGSFIELNGESITAAASVDGTTDASGQFTLTYSCTEWGLVTFSANNTSIQARINGWKSIDISVSYASFYVNEGERLCKLMYYRTGYNYSDTATKTLHSGVIPSKYRVLAIGVTNDPVITFYVNADGNILSRSTAAGSKTINANIYWSY